jgi:phosphoserine aminotransferase
LCKDPRAKNHKGYGGKTAVEIILHCFYFLKLFTFSWEIDSGKQKKTNSIAFLGDFKILFLDVYMSTRVFNFNAGPAMLPEEVMKQAQNEFLDYKGSGMSVMEMSHRGSLFQSILDKAESDLRELLNLDEEFSIGFFPGGASLQFSAIPLNLLEAGDTASYALTGVWSVKALQEAKKFYPNVQSIFDGKPESYHRIPKFTESDLKPNSRYFYMTANNTIYGTQYPSFPDLPVPIVADMTSEILSRTLPLKKFGVIFAGAQKNIGPSGLTLVIVKKSLLKEMAHPIPNLMNWKLICENQSLYNTPPTYSIYIAGLVFDWLKRLGGIPVMEKINSEKSEVLYSALDSSGLFFAPVPKEIRSQMNVVFHLKEKSLEKKFEQESESAGLIGLKGHRDAGGFRASIYNAMPLEGVQALVQFLKEFEKKNG